MLVPRILTVRCCRWDECFLPYRASGVGLQQHEGFVSLRQGGGPGHVPVLLPAQVCRSSYQSPSVLDFACGCVPAGTARLPTDRSVSRILGAPLQVLGSFPPPGTALTSSGGSLPARLQVAVIPAVLSQERACHIGAAFRFSQQKTTFWFTLQMLPRSSEDVVETLGSFGPEGSRADGGEVSRSPWGWSGMGAGKAPWCMMSFLPVPGWGCRAAVGPSGHGVMVSAADGPVAQYHPVRADSFHLASLNPTVWVLGAQAMQKRLRSFLSSPNPHQELKKFCNECDVQLGLQVSGPCCMLKGDSGGLGVGNVVRWRVTSFKMQMWVRNWKDTVTGHVYSCRDTLESQTKVVLRQQLHSVEALGNPSQDQERAFV